MKNYRDQLDREAYQYSDLADYDFDDKEELVPKDVVTEMMDEIESTINDIIYNLEPISGLTKIDEIKDMMSELSAKLY